jgi:hypothetical protein
MFCYTLTPQCAGKIAAKGRSSLIRTRNVVADGNGVTFVCSDRLGGCIKLCLDDLHLADSCLNLTTGFAGEPEYLAEPIS